VASLYSKPGDSGSPIFSAGGPFSFFIPTPIWPDSAAFHGILWGGPVGDFTTSYYSALTGVETDLGYSFDVVAPSAPPPTVDPPTWVSIDFGPDQVKPNEVCTWFGSAGGGDPPYTLKWYKGPALVQTDVGTSTELNMNTGTSDFVLKLIASNSGGSVQTTLDVDVTTSAMTCFM
jgi:hypothetical protein